MLETPKSAKTPSTGGISNSCATSAILENGDCTSVTFSPKLFSRSPARSSACASRSRLINRPDVNCSAMAAEWPPAPSVTSMYIPSGFIRSHSITSSNSTGVCGAFPVTRPSLNPTSCLNSQRVQRVVVVFRVRFVLQLVQHPGVIHHLEIIHHAEHVHIAFGLRRFTQHRRQQHSSLSVHFHHLPKVAGAHQKLSLGAVGARQGRQLVLDLRPDLQRVHARRFARRARDIELVSVLLQFLQKHGGYLQPAFLVDFRLAVSPQFHVSCS